MRKPAPRVAVSPATPALRVLGQPVETSEEVSDETLGVEIRRRLDLMGVEAMVSVVIEVNDRVVILRGVAPDRASAWRAEAAARSVQGVQEVKNQLMIRDR